MKLFSLFIILTCSNLFAQEQKETDLPSTFLVIKPFDSKTISYLEESNINKTILRVATKQKDYQLSLSPDVDFVGVRNQVYSVSISLVKKGIVYTVQAILTNLKKNEVDFKVVRDNVARNGIQREVEIALEMLFEGGEKVKEEQKEEKPLNKAVKGEKMKPVDSGIAAFKARVLSIKNALKKKFKVIKKKLIKEEEEEEEKETNEKQEKKTNQTETKQSNKNKKKETSSNPKPGDILNKLEEFTYVGMGYWDHDINSNYLIDTSTYIPLLNFTMKKGFFFDEDSQFYHLYTVGYGSLTEEYEIEVEPATNFSGGLGFKYDAFRLQTELHLAYHTMTFGNLTDVGEGIVAANHTHYWLDYHLGFRFLLGRFPIKINGHYGTIIGGDSSFPKMDSSTLTGTRIGLEFLVFRAWKMISITGGWYTMDLSIQRESPVTIGDFTFTEMTAKGTSLQIAGVYTY